MIELGFDLYEAILEEFRYRGIIYEDIFAPPLICSTGLHLFNIANKDIGAWIRSGTPVDSRLHVGIIAPTRFGKTLFIRQTICENVDGETEIGKHSILYGTQIDQLFEGKITEAGLIGTIGKGEDGEGNVKLGDAYKYPHAIIGAEEFAAITKMGKTTHSGDMDEAMLLILDTGHAPKRLAHGRISRVSAITLWFGTQSQRYDLTSGMGGRLWFVMFIPGQKEKKEVLLAWKRAMNKGINVTDTAEIRKEINKKKKEVRKITRVNVGEEEHLWQFILDHDIHHGDAELYQRFQLGYTIMKTDPLPRVLDLMWDSELEKQCLRQREWRNSIQSGTEYLEMLKVLTDHGGKISLKDLRNAMLLYGINWQQSMGILKQMDDMSLVDFDKATGMVSKI